MSCHLHDMDKSRDSARSCNCLISHAWEIVWQCAQLYVRVNAKQLVRRYPIIIFSENLPPPLPTPCCKNYPSSTNELTKHWKNPNALGFVQFHRPHCYVDISMDFMHASEMPQYMNLCIYRRMYVLPIYTSTVRLNTYMY